MAGELIAQMAQNALTNVGPFSNLMAGAQDYNTLQNQLLNNQLLQQRYSQAEQMNPLLMQEAQNKLALQGQDITTGQMTLDQAKQGQLIRDMQTIATEALQMPGQSRRQHILGRLKAVDFAGLDENELINEIGQLDDTQLEQSLRSMMSVADKGGDTADIETFKYLNRIIAPAVVDGVFDESKATPEQLAAAKQLGLVAKAGTMTQGEREAYDPYLASTITGIEAGRAGATAGAAESAKLDVQAEKQPKLEAAKEQARLEVQAKVEKQIAQQGQLGRLGDAQMIYSDLMPDGPEDLSKLSRIYGRGESFYPKILRSQEGINTIAQRDQLVSMLQLGARGELKGQGPITENEQAILSKAITILSEPDIEPKLAARYINQAMNILGRNAGKATTTPEPTGGQAKQFKSGSGITFTVE